MRPECTPLMFASVRDVAWYLGKELCRDYPEVSKIQQEGSERLVWALINCIGDERFAQELEETLDCAKQLAASFDDDEHC